MPFKKVKRTPIKEEKREERWNCSNSSTELSLDILLKAIKLARSTTFITWNTDKPDKDQELKAEI